MSRKTTIRFFCALLFVLCAGFAADLRAQTGTFTYQGRLTDSTNPSGNGAYNMQFALYNDSTASQPANLLGTITLSGVQVSNSGFAVQLNAANFGANAFDGADRYLEVRVFNSATDSYVTLTPRQQITSSPYSLRTLSASAADNLSPACVGCVTSAQVGSLDGAKVTGTVANANSAETANAANKATTANTATTAGNVTGIVAVANGGTGSASKNFVDLTEAQTVGGAKTFAANLRLNGLTRVGSETGTSDAPRVSSSNLSNVYAGLVARRVNSLTNSAGNVVARTGNITLERDGTFSGLRIQYQAASDQDRSLVCMGVNSSNASVDIRIIIPQTAGISQVYTNAQSMEFVQCSFGDFFYLDHLTQVTLQRSPSDYVWVGTVTSTFNQ